MQMTKFIALAFLLLLAGCQCGCTHSGQIVRFEQRSNVGISTVEIAEYTIPIISISSGPSFTVYQREGQPCLTKISGFATTTNTTSALGIYSSSENKSMQFKDVVITNCHTNDWPKPLK